MAEKLPGGLLDKVLELRTVPDPTILLGRLSMEAEDVLERDPEADMVVGWRAAIDAVMDLLVPTLKQVVMLPNSHNPNACIYKPDVETLIGRVPLTRTERGWR